MARPEKTGKLVHQNENVAAGARLLCRSAYLPFRIGGDLGGGSVEQD